MTKYDTDVIAWANEQAGFIRAGRFDLLDLEHLADEIEDVGKSEQREFESRMAVLLAHLIKWQYQPERRCKSWEKTVKEQRKRVAIRLKKTPSLKAVLNDPDFWADVWPDAKSLADKETGLLDRFPDDCPWLTDEILADNWLP